MMVTCCWLTKIDINCNYYYALQIQWRTLSAYCGDKGNPEGSPFHAAGAFWILSFSGSGSFNRLLGNGLYPAGKQDPTWLVGFKTGNHDGETYLLSFSPTTLPGQVIMSTSSYSDASPAPSSTGTSDHDPLTLPPFLFPLELQNLCESANNVTELEILATPHPQLYQWIAHFQALDQTIQCLECLVQKEQEELHKVFSVLEVEGITEVLAPLIVQKRTKWYRPYKVYRRWWPSPTSIPLPDSPPIPSLIPSRPPTPSPKLPLPSLKLLSSYHTASSQPPVVIRCKGCDEEGHVLEKCTHNYRWHPDTETYMPIPYGEKMTIPHSGWTPVLVLEKTGKSSV